jgi:hypothetical protein
MNKKAAFTRETAAKPGYFYKKEPLGVEPNGFLAIS